MTGVTSPRGQSAPLLGVAGLSSFPDCKAGLGRFSQAQRAIWEEQVESPWVLSTMIHGYRLQFRGRPPPFTGIRPTTVADPLKRDALRKEVSVLLDKKAIRILQPLERQGGFYSAYFVIPKKTGGLRPVLDLRGVNHWLKRMKFRMLSPARVLQAMSKGLWFTTIDLKDAYFQIPIHPSCWKYLRFAFEGVAYEFMVLPFGLSLAPRTFTKCMEAVLAPLAARGVTILNYLDDWLVCAHSEEEVRLATCKVVQHIQQLGLVLNHEKSHLTPSQVVTFIGISLDAQVMRASLPQPRVETILSVLNRFQLGQKVSVWDCQRLLGLLTAASLLVPLGLLHLRPLQLWFNSHGCHPKRHRHRRLMVTTQCMRALSKWRSRSFLSQGVELHRVCRRELVCTDSSLTGWGAVHNGRSASGQWKAPWLGSHINVLELRAVHLALQSFLPSLKDRHVLVRTDNATVVAYINHQGGVRSPRLHRVAERLLLWAHAHLASLRAAFIPGAQNTAADMLSRAGPQEGDWHLHTQVVQQIWMRFGQAQVDLFAASGNAQCPLWFSVTWPPGPLGLDALAHDWPAELLFAFPPVPLIPAVLDRTKLAGHRLILIAPYWPRRPWFSLLSSLIVGTPWQLPLRPDLLSQAGGTLWHPEPRRLNLWAWPLSGADGQS